MDMIAALWSEHPLFKAVVGALVIGAIGSVAYLTALFLGFLGSPAIDQLRPRFEVIRGRPPVSRLSRIRVALFGLLGSCIAVVFQLAQGTAFAPIQAFVLGATWPTVVSQVLTKTGETDPEKIKELADRIAGRTPG